MEARTRNKYILELKQRLSKGIIVNQPTNVWSINCDPQTIPSIIILLPLKTFAHSSLPNMASEKSKILVIGGTGYIGKFIVEASAKAGHTTFALVREATLSDPVKGKTVQTFKDLGVTILHVRLELYIFYYDDS